jgi:hypothetical protein
MRANPFTGRVIGTLRRGTTCGRPPGSDGFISKVEVIVGRRLQPLLGGTGADEPTSAI